MARETELKTIVQSIYAAAGSGHWGAVRNHMADNLVIIEAESLPFAGRYEGPDALQRLFAIVMGHWADPDVQLHAMTAGDDHVIALVTFAMTSRVTGKRMSMPLAEVWRLNADLKVDLIQPYYFDSAAVAALDRP